MKLCRYGNPGQELPAVWADNQRYDISAFGEDYNEPFFETGGLARLSEWFDLHKTECRIIEESLRWAPCIARPSKIICIGLNYADHAAETNMAKPAEPIVFFKSTSSITGPYDDLIIPRNSSKTDWEVELAIVIGKKTSYIEPSAALEHIAGYTLHNDYSERAFQLERGGQWVKGKSCDSFAPIGPWMATPEELKDVHDLRLWLTVNGKIYQDGNTRNFIFNIPYIVSYLSQFMTLLPGDLISTGTPAGVGMGQKPAPIYLKAGDVIELGIDGLGSSRQVAKDYV